MFIGKYDDRVYPEDEGATILRNVGNYLPIDTKLTSQDLQLWVHAVRRTDLAALYNICQYILSPSSVPQPEFELDICYIQVRCFVAISVCVVFHQVYWVGIFQVLLILNLSSCKWGFEGESHCYDRQLLAKLCRTSACVLGTTWSLYIQWHTYTVSLIWSFLIICVNMGALPWGNTYFVYRTYSTGTGFSFRVGTRCVSRTGQIRGFSFRHRREVGSVAHPASYPVATAGFYSRGREVREGVHSVLCCAVGSMAGVWSLAGTDFSVAESRWILELIQFLKR